MNLCETFHNIVKHASVIKKIRVFISEHMERKEEKRKEKKESKKRKKDKNLFDAGLAWWLSKLILCFQHQHLYGH